MADNQLYLPLSKQEYEYGKAFLSFQKRTSQYNVMLKMIDPIAKELHGKPIDMMSIGPGDGKFENSFAKIEGIEWKYFHAIEPDKPRRKELANVLKKWKTATAYFIDHHLFGEDYKTEKKFDIILMPHVLYCIPNPARAILKAKRFLKDHGKLVVFHDAREGFSDLRRAARKIFDPMMQNYSGQLLSAEDISEKLRELDEDHKFQTAQTLINVTDVILKQDGEETNDLMSFFMQTRFDKLPQHVQSIAYNKVKDGCILNEDNKWFFQNPTAMIVLQG
eukprot:gene10218-11266_t